MMETLKKVKELFFANKQIKLSVGLEGQKCDGTTYIVGCKAGPSVDIQNLLHELCHFAELEKERLLLFPRTSWGLKFGKFWSFGQHWGYEPQTSEQVEREARVWAFQLSASKYFGLNANSHDYAKTAVWLPAFTIYECGFTGKASDCKAIYKLSKHIERLSKNRFTFDKLIDDFNDRIKLLENNNGTV